MIAQGVEALPQTHMLAARPSFAFVIPTYNEAGDIADTLAAVLGQRRPALEVIVVDGGSVDGTRDIVRQFARRHPGVVLIEEGARRGVAAARNIGMRAATADVVVLLNADVRPQPDFLERLAPLYETGADFVSVNSHALNVRDATARFLQAEHEERYGADCVGWTEGFSCRRDAAVAAGFPEEIPGLGGEDVEFFDRLRAAGHEWRVDYSIVVPHRVPSTLRGFIDQWRWRGNAIPYIETRLQRRSLDETTARRALAAAKTIAKTLLLVPNARWALRCARRSPRGLRDVPVFWLLCHVQQFSHRAGEWQTLRALWRERRTAA